MTDKWDIPIYWFVAENTLLSGRPGRRLVIAHHWAKPGKHPAIRTRSGNIRFREIERLLWPYQWSISRNVPIEDTEWNWL